MPKLRDLTGQRFGAWMVLRRIKVPSRFTAWLCRCDCGTEKPVNAQHLYEGISRSCGCLGINPDAKVTHGKSKTKVYRVWADMLQRCQNPKSCNYKFYGARGIKVCDRWQDFENFLADMGERPTEHHSIERIEVNGNYEPGNCRWATRKEQYRNRRNNRLITFQGKTLTLGDWAAEIGLSSNSLSSRINTHKWPIEKALTTPLGERK